MKTILITGGSGFIGSNLVNYFLKKKYKVIDLDILSYCSTPNKYRGLINIKNYQFVKANINNKSKIINLFKSDKINSIYNLAANSHVDRSIDEPVKFYKSNVLSTLDFLESLLYLKKKKFFSGQVINISTDEVYGDVKKIAKNEDSTIETNSPYSASKASIETIFRSYYKTFNLPFKNIRCCNNYGEYQHTEKFIPTIIINCIAGKKIPIYGDGLQKREWIHVYDFCNAIDFIEKKGKLGENYNVGSNYRIENISLAKKIIKIVKSFNVNCNTSLIHKVKDRLGHDRNYKLNSNKLRKMGWKSSININHGLIKTVKWYLSNPKWIEYTKKKYDGERLGLKNDR